MAPPQVLADRLRVDRLALEGRRPSSREIAESCRRCAQDHRSRLVESGHPRGNPRGITGRIWRRQQHDARGATSPGGAMLRGAMDAGRSAPMNAVRLLPSSPAPTVRPAVERRGVARRFFGWRVAFFGQAVWLWWAGSGFAGTRASSAVDADRLGDVLQGLRAEIVEPGLDLALT